jgi:PAS domain S-box-containing protein
VDQDSSNKGRKTESISEAIRALAAQSPVGTWIADRHGTCLLLNESARRYFGAEHDEELIGKYNIFADEQIAACELMPQIKHVFEQGGFTDFILEHDFYKGTSLPTGLPSYNALHVYALASNDSSGAVDCVIFQQEPCSIPSHAFSREIEGAPEMDTMYRSLVEQSLVGIYVLLDNLFVYINPRFAELYGYTQEEIIGHKTADDLASPESRDTIAQHIRRRAAGKERSSHYAIKGLRKDGTTLDVEVFSTGAKFRGKPATVGTLIDVTAQKRAENALKTSERRLGDIINFLPDATFAIDNDGKIIIWNRATEELTGYKAEEMLGKGDFEYAIPFYGRRRPMLINMVFKPEEAKETYGDTLKIEKDTLFAEAHTPAMKPGGAYIWGKASPLRDVSGNVIGAIESVRDITDRKRTAEALKENEERLRTLINAMPDIVCFKDGNGRWLEANDFDLKLFELTGVDYRGKTDCDLAEYSGFYRDAFMNCGETDEVAWRAGKAVRADEVIPSPSGVSHVFDIIKVPTFNQDGSRKGLVVIGRDVTERVQAEDALKASERRLSDIINFLPDATFAIDLDGRIIAWNHATEEMTGFRADEMLGKGDHAYSIPFYRERRPMLIDMVSKPEAAKEIYTILHITGSTLTAEAYTPVMVPGGAYLWGKASPLYDAKGNVVGAIETVRDITDRVRAEAATRELEEHKREFYRKTILAATEGKLTITDHREIEELGGEEVGCWEIEKGEDLGMVRKRVADTARKAGMDEDRIHDFVLTVGEATTNAYKHAKGGRACLYRLPNALLCIISDHGPGIAAVTLPEVALVKGYSTAGTLGMGYKAIISMADRVYLVTGPTGTTVAIEMEIAPKEKPSFASIIDTWSS